MRKIEFDPLQDIPLVDAIIEGALRSRRIKLVFDTGCAITQIDTSLMETAGYSISDAYDTMSVHGPTGDQQEGYLVKARCLSIFGNQFEEVDVGVYDFDNFARYGIDGLLGWNMIRQFHLEMNGPLGSLTIF